ncbi:MAG: 1-acyl-sn-glycerol-3-phosphate acyltransferase [Paludibacter sp.]|nr:1-acyl-sn-glycerol-3-phosphate acyltransferase [Paludibacter sp.]
MSKIYDFTLPFSIVRNYVIFTFKRFYSEFIVVGKENIPVNEPIIFAPNHINALMDALAVHSVSSNKIPLIFLARSDIFNNKIAAKILKFAKILPAFRMRDGMDKLGKNQEIFDQCVEILDHNNALGIMPEGNQGEQKKLRPLVKGIFRIGFAAQQKYGTNKGVKIIPVGIDLGDYVKFGKHIIVNVGKPIEVSDYMALYAENPITATNEIRDKLRDDLNKLSLNLATEKFYDCFVIATEVANTAVLNELKLPDKTIYRFVARQKIAEKLVSLEKNDPDEIIKLDLLCKEYTNLLKKINLKTWVLERKVSGILQLFLDGLLLFWTLPVFIVGFMLNFLPFFLPVFIRKNVIKAKDIGFFSTLHFALGIITVPLFYMLQTVIFYSLLSVPFWVAAIFFFLQYFCGKCALKWYRDMIKYFAKIRYRKMTLRNSMDLQSIQNIRKQIIHTIN